MRWLVILLSGLVGIYLACLLTLFVFQRNLMYLPGGPIGPAASFGLPDTQTLHLRADDGETIVAWYQPAKADKPLYLYFHGNGGTLAVRATVLRNLSEDGSGFLAIDYDGYGGSSGSPSETGLRADGEAAYAEAQRLGYGADRIIVFGESLGTGVAVGVAANHPEAALILDSAFSSTADVAASQYWVFPVRWLMRDTFQSIALIDRVKAPKLFLHCEGDPIIPIALARRLYDAASPPKTFIAVPGAGHMVLWQPDIMARMKAWVAALPGKA